MTSRSRVELPSHVTEPFEVYINGVQQQRGTDYHVEGRALCFERELAQEGRLGFWRWLSIFFGVAGTYRKHETVDLVYQAAGRRTVETGLPVSAEGDVEPG
jgi:hypothetical protein